MDRHVDFNIDTPRRLRLTIPGLREVKRRAGLTLGQLLLGLAQLDVDCMVWLLWASARWEDPKLTDRGAETLLEKYMEAGHTLEDIAELVQEIAERSGLLKRADDGAEEDPDADDPPTASIPSTSGSRSSGDTHSDDSSSDHGSSSEKESPPEISLTS